MDIEPATKTAPPLTSIEHTVAVLWQEALGASVLPMASDDFFNLGGDSIAMVTAIALIQEELAVALPDDALFKAPSLRELAALVDSTLNTRVEHGVQPDNADR